VPSLPTRWWPTTGRLLSYAYDGCSRPLLLTEFARYQQGWVGRSLPPRTVRFPIDPATGPTCARQCSEPYVRMLKACLSWYLKQPSNLP